MRLATDPRFLEAVANEPRNHRWLSPEGYGPVEVSPEAFAGMRVLEFEDGVFTLADRGDAVSVHCLFMPKATDTEGKARQVFAYAFAQGADRLVTQIVGDCWHAKRFARRLGFRLFDVEKDAWPRAGGAVDLEWYELRANDDVHC